MYISSDSSNNNSNFYGPNMDPSASGDTSGCSQPASPSTSSSGAGNVISSALNMVEKNPELLMI